MRFNCIPSFYFCFLQEIQKLSIFFAFVLFVQDFQRYKVAKFSFVIFAFHFQ